MDVSSAPPLLAWQAPTRIDHDRSARWYTVAGLIAGTLILYGVVTNAWSMSLVVALVAGLYFVVRNQKHQPHSIRLLPLGIEYDGTLEPWDRWQDFWILAGNGFAELHINRKGFRSELQILTGEQDPFAVRDTLIQFIPQSGDKRERILDAFIRYCKI